MKSERREEFRLHLPWHLRMLRHTLFPEYINLENTELFFWFFERMDGHKRLKFKRLSDVIAQNKFRRYFNYSNCNPKKIRALFSAIETCKQSYRSKKYSLRDRLDFEIFIRMAQTYLFIWATYRVKDIQFIELDKIEIDHHGNVNILLEKNHMNFDLSDLEPQFYKNIKWLNLIAIGNDSNFLFNSVSFSEDSKLYRNYPIADYQIEGSILAMKSLLSVLI